MDQIILPTYTIAAGTSKSGKTYLIRYLLKSFCLRKQFQLGLVFTGTKFSGDYTSFLPTKYVFDGFDQPVLLAFLETMKKFDHRTQEQVENGDKCLIPHTFVVFDDILDEMNLQSKPMKKFFATARHYNISLFFSTQYIHQATPLIRNQAENCFMFQHDNKHSIEALYESFGQTLEKERTFKRMLYENTKEKYTCVMYKKEEREIDKKFTQFRAPDKVPKVKFKF